MKREQRGRHVVSTAGGETVRAYVPPPLPPVPGLSFDDNLRTQFEQAQQALGRLDGLSLYGPGTPLLLYSFVRKEAVLSSQIEGTQSTLSDLLLFELDEVPGVPLNDVVEVSNYVAAMEHGLARARSGLPLSNRLVREIHAILLSRGRGAGKAPGEFRRTQNWIGGSRPGDAHFVPPPPQELEGCMSELERFLHDRSVVMTPLLRAGLAHVQFETIHPFLDGNGRVGRLLIALILVVSGAMREPLLYVSLYFKQHRTEYYGALDRVRAEGDWEQWLVFFARAVQIAAESAARTAEASVSLMDADRQLIQAHGRAVASALQVHEVLRRTPVTNGAHLVQQTGLSKPTVNAALGTLQSLGIVSETSGRKRGRIFHYASYLDLLQQDTEPLDSSVE
jgi:Fic family protein